jgi:transposase
VVDLEAGALVSVSVHPADRSDKATIEEAPAGAEENLQRVEAAEDRDDDNGLPGGLPTEGTRVMVADKEYNIAVLLRRLKEKGYSSFIPERRQAGKHRWTDKGGRETASAFCGNRARVKRKKGKGLQRKRGELIERAFAHICNTGGARCTRLFGIENGGQTLPIAGECSRSWAGDAESVRQRHTAGNLDCLSGPPSVGR